MRPSRTIVAATLVVAALVAATRVQGPTVPDDPWGAREIPWRVYPTSVDTFRAWRSGTAAAPEEGPTPGGTIAFAAVVDGRSSFRSAFFPLDPADAVGMWVRAPSGITLSLRLAAASLIKDATAWKQGAEVRIAGDGSWQEVKLRSATDVGMGGDFGRITVVVDEGAGRVELSAPTTGGIAGACRALFAWTDGTVPVHPAGGPLVLHWVSARPIDPAMLSLALFDARGASIPQAASPHAPATTGGGLSVAVSQPGWYLAELSANGCRVPWPFVVTPRVSGAPRAEQLGLQLELDSVGLAKAELLGVSWLRTNRADVTTWPRVAPDSTTRVWPDSLLRSIAGRGFKILGTLHLTPLWASSDPKAPSYPRVSTYFGPAAHLPRRLSDWTEYVASITRRYRGVVSAWEVWNEPDIQFLVPAAGMTHVAAYDSLLRSARPVIKAQCPECLVVGPAVAFGISQDRATPPAPYQSYREHGFLDGFFAEGDTALVDVFSYHAYVTPECATTPNCASEGLRTLVHKARGLGQRPVWRTEAGLMRERIVGGGCVRGVEEETRHSALMLADDVATLANGVARVFPFHGFFSEAPCDQRALFFDGHAPRPAAAAFATLASLLVSRTVVPPPPRGPGGAPVLALLVGARDSVWALAPIPATRYISVSGSGRVVGQWGGGGTGVVQVPRGELAYLVGEASQFRVVKQ